LNERTSKAGLKELLVQFVFVKQSMNFEKVNKLRE